MGLTTRQSHPLTIHEPLGIKSKPKRTYMFQTYTAHRLGLRECYTRFPINLLQRPERPFFYDLGIIGVSPTYTSHVSQITTPHIREGGSHCLSTWPIHDDVISHSRMVRLCWYSHMMSRTVVCADIGNKNVYDKHFFSVCQLQICTIDRSYLLRTSTCIRQVPTWFTA